MTLIPRKRHTTEEVAKRSRKIYEESVRSELGAEAAGKFVVIDTDSGDSD